MERADCCFQCSSGLLPMSADLRHRENGSDGQSVSRKRPLVDFTREDQDSGYSFSLEAVKTLKKLMEFDTSTNPSQTYGNAESLCADPDLPREFRELCGKHNVNQVFQNLVRIISPIDPCEICANVACTGC
ncbi:guanylin isoform X1 [Danio rerio]|uniref:Guanylin isoform X1 n=1 Tax=Danio rerio TaxID=7955 RepID=A0AC58GT76_DANRE